MDAYIAPKKDFFSSFFVKARPYLASLVVVLVCVFPLFKFEYSTDTYHFALSDGLFGISSAMHYNGRLLPYFVITLLDKLGVGFTAFYYVSFVMSIIFTTLSITTLYKTLRGHISRNFAFFLAIITILNPLSFEHFLFIEKGFFAFAIFMAVLSAKMFLLFLQGKRPFLILSYVFLTLCAFTYQALPATFVSLALVFLVIYFKNIKSFILNSLICVSVYGFSTFMIFIVMKAASLTERTGGGLNFYNVYKFITFGLASPYMLLVYVGIFAVLFGIVFGTSKKKTGKMFTKESLFTFFKYSFVIVFTVLATSAPCPFSKTEDVWFTFRFAYPIGLLCGTIPMLYSFRLDKTEHKEAPFFSKRVRKASIIMLATLFLFMALFHAFFFSRHITNAGDKNDAMEIGRIISEYEKETGYEVKKIYIYYDAEHSDGHKGAVFMPNCNVRALTRSWCDVEHLSLFHSRSYEDGNEKGDKDYNTEYANYFSENDWDEINEEMFIFEGETLHLCVY